MKKEEDQKEEEEKGENNKGREMNREEGDGRKDTDETLQNIWTLITFINTFQANCTKLIKVW